MIGIDLFPADRRQVLQDHARLPVLPRTPATFWERAELAFRESFRTETSIGVEWMYYRRWEKALDALEEKTGEALVNPFALRGPTRREALDRARRKLLEARAEHPDLPDPDSFDADIRREVGALRAERVKAGEVSTPGGTLGDLAGTMAAVMTDPVNIASMAAGAPAAAGILRTALIEAGIAAASETAIQAIVAPQKKALGLEVSLGESAANVALAAAGGGILGGSVKALAKGARALLGSGRRLPLRVRDAARIVQHQEKTLDDLPFGLYADPDGPQALLDPSGNPIRVQTSRLHIESRHSHVFSEWYEKAAAQLGGGIFVAVESPEDFAPAIEALVDRIVQESVENNPCADVQVPVPAGAAPAND